MKAPRRSILKRLLATLTSAAGADSFTNAFAEGKPQMEVPSTDVPLYSGSTRLGNMIFVSGAGAHFEGDIKAHTDHVLKEIEKELIKAGSSMDKVLKVNVLLHDLKDYKAMNEVYKGRFGNKPPVRTTVSTHAGVPGNSLVEIDCIAYV
ncbi:RidA family protein [Spirosoma radiotolerans]|uniref:Endoribonuclease L-PSP n=1 Tax=Spirosoma radiotolerans TaxID=1379870 RepID=A0A0E3ZU54_9BACT|nr:RidA family protein [Spirosoma radiotolerans]AKD54233.1 endoribonuclease L-PSP [Spirosoma radiotolerans]